MLVDKVLPSSSAKYFVLSPAHILTYTDKMEKMEEKKMCYAFKYYHYQCVHVSVLTLAGLR